MSEVLSVEGDGREVLVPVSSSTARFNVERTAIFYKQAYFKGYYVNTKKI
jgi:hypothetical protein